MTATASNERIVESWRRREPPLQAVAILGVGAVATALAAATHRRVADGAALRTVVDPEYLVVLGDERRCRGSKAHGTWAGTAPR
ncbi:hypothetical protein ACFQ9X_16590 [Catenulispora yoronensis]